MNKILLSVIVPSYKQENTIIKDLTRIKIVLEQLRYETELICVVDGKTDETFNRAETLTHKFKNLRVIGYQTNKGKGHAIRFGMAASHGNIIAFIDSGMDIDPNGLSMALEHFEWYNADVIVGSKRHPASKIVYPWQRRVLSFGYQILVFLLFGLKIKDTQVGLKIYKRALLEKVLPRLLVKAYAFDIEILAVANYLGFERIYEAPVNIELKFGGSSVITNRKFAITVLKMLSDTLAVFYRLKIRRYYDDNNYRKWKFDPELNFRINIG